MKRGKSPTARQKRWHDAVAQLPCVSCGATPVHVHHCVGSSAKHNKVHIGQDWVIPLCPDCHQGQGGVHGDMSRIHENRALGLSRKDFEKLAFRECVVQVSREVPLEHSGPTVEAAKAIMGYHK